ncbi:MAG: PSD1 domain-containing protein [Verrucomicrobia bacterium]|nr:PSD1 domain-containing protein [Verrucomicrobiota bacterium]
MPAQRRSPALCPATCAIALLALTPASAGDPRPSAPADSRTAEQLFAREVLPLLQAKCLACHGRDEAKIKGGLDLRTREAASAGGDSAKPAIVPLQPDASPLYLAVTRSHADWEPMPPKANDALTARQVEHVRTWIAGGAPWPDDTQRAAILAESEKWTKDEGIRVPTSGGLSAGWTDRRYPPADLWAYQPLRKPPVPAVPVPATSPADAAPNPIDAFIHARLATAQLPPAPRADRRTLLRRVTFDLTGLPPTPEEIAAFVSDPAPDGAAFASVIDRLLESPHYGEQMARHWLDIVRYADTSGFANDFARGNAWRYRDYVVRSFNADLPYDRFIREQIAGDELAPANPEAIVATGFLRMGPWELTGMEVPRIARQRFLDDVTDSVGQVFLAHPLQCARCHDHKFDPVPTRDYYALQAIFATTQLAERPAAFLPNENTTGFEEKRLIEARLAHYRAILRRLDEKSITAARAWYAAKQLDPARFEKALAGTTGRKNARGRDAGYTEVRAALLRQGLPEDQVPPRHAGFTTEDYGLERIARKGLERLRWELDRYEPIALAVYSGRTPALSSVLAPLRPPADPHTQGELEATAILTGGDPFSPGAPVVPAMLSAPTSLGDMPPELARAPAEIAGRRTALAAWLASPQNPLPARVIANRVWLWHFGRGLAGNPNNFGVNGRKPTHPELLDWLAATLIERGWSLKALHRLILNSATYARSSSHPQPSLVTERDPHGTLHAVFAARRLAAEELRDASLAVSGELNRTLGGIPVRPEINREAALQPRQVMGTFAEAWQPSPQPEQRHRRSLYALRIRGQPDPFMEVFNAPNADLSCETREASTVTPQVFALFNSEASLARAVAWAERLRRETASRPAAVQRAFALAFGRAPTPAELQQSLAHWEAMNRRHVSLAIERPARPREVIREAVDENTGEKFTFVEPLEAADAFLPDRHLGDLPAEFRGLADLCLVLLNTNEFAYLD